MNRRAMINTPIFRRHRLAGFFLPLAIALTVPACTQQQEPPLAGAAIGGPFTLSDSAGKTVQWSDFKGKYRIVYFGYTYCPDVCPMEMQRIMKGYDQFKASDPQAAAQVQPIFISIDPERDTPAKVGEFARAFSNDLMGLTGTPEQVKAAAKGFGVYFQKGETTKSGAYLVDHSNAAYLMGRDGEPIALLPIDKGTEAPAAIAAELERWTS